MEECIVEYPAYACRALIIEERRFRILERLVEEVALGQELWSG